MLKESYFVDEENEVVVTYSSRGHVYFPIPGAANYENSALYRAVGAVDRVPEIDPVSCAPKEGRKSWPSAWRGAAAHLRRLLRRGGARPAAAARPQRDLLPACAR